MSRKSKVELSPHYHEILDMIKEGFSSRDISDYLQEEYNEKIAHGTINNYAQKIRSKIKQEYHKKKKEKKSKSLVEEKKDREETFKEVVNDGVSDLNALDNIIKEADNVNLNIGNLKAKRYSDYVITTEADIEDLKIKAKRLAIQAVNAKAKILKDDSGNNVNIGLPVVITNEEKEQLEKEIEDELR